MHQLLHALLAIWALGSVFVGLMLLFSWGVGAHRNLRPREWFALFCWLPVVIGCLFLQGFMWLADKVQCR